MKLLLLKKDIWWPSTITIDKFAKKLENIHRISYVVGVVNGSYIHIMIPRLHAGNYYNRKEFHYYCSVLYLANAHFGILTYDGSIHA